jgi:mono/diheme cytochrome c family protein
VVPDDRASGAAASARARGNHVPEGAPAEASDTVRPNLDELKPPADRVAEQVRNGGGGMPAFDGRLDDAQIEAVSDYVAQVAGQGGGGGVGGGTP